ncbi:DUF2635 domain-containing protein [Xanthobacter autotrophicus]|uniref:DUF2635 domain-containing protein n=1 Tax=Xanthobacter TaxID=279 RepID=UPI0024ABBAB9|nr:DUF2635 domain-containing protein [Xanthobacter autotrophicus]MDI4664714.1 DUF2635 domain-containing protein [Xanthobacter autotrophicus]
MADADKIFARPAPGLTLPLPDGRPWPAEGDWVEKDRYVRRRLAAREIEIVDPPPASAVPAETAPAPAEPAAAKTTKSRS